MRRKLAFTLESNENMSNFDDTLEVTKAIQIIQSTDEMDTVEDVINKQKEVKEQEDALKDPEQGQDDANADGATTGEIKDITDDEMHDFDTALDDVQTLESVIDKITNCVTTEAYHCKSVNITLEADSVTQTVLSTLKRIWDKLVEFVNKVVDTVQYFVEMQRSKLKTAKDELDNLQESLKLMIEDRQPRFKVIENEAMAQLLTITPDKNTVQEMMSSITLHTKMAKSYFEHIRAHYVPYINSVNALFTEDYPESIEGPLLIGKNTLPSVMVKVQEIDGFRKPHVSMEAYRTAWMAKGTVLASFVSPDNKVTTEPGTDNVVLESKMFLALDPTYVSGVDSLPVMTKPELSKYLDLMETLRSTLSQGELQLMHYFKAVQEFNKQIKSNYREAMAISKSARADELQAQAQGKRKIGMMLSRCLGVTEKFYGNPNRAFMNFSNTILSASVRYCLDCIKAYTYVNSDKKSV